METTTKAAEYGTGARAHAPNVLTQPTSGLDRLQERVSRLASRGVPASALLVIGGLAWLGTSRWMTRHAQTGLLQRWLPQGLRLAGRNKRRTLRRLAAGGGRAVDSTNVLLSAGALIGTGLTMLLAAKLISRMKK